MNGEMHCGDIGFVGRPNVGKSTLLNALLGKKISITSYKPQTTRYKILGVKTQDNTQMIYLDTPGLHMGEAHLMNRYMNRLVRATIFEVDVLLFVVEPEWTPQDQWILDQLKEMKNPIVLVINKIDRLKEKAQLLPYLKKLSGLFPFTAMIPVSAKKQDKIEDLESTLIPMMPIAPFRFLKGEVTDSKDEFFAAEIIREKLMRVMQEEIPYVLAVTIVAFMEEENINRISAVIWVDKKSQKGIVIGKGGATLKQIGTQARRDMENYFKKKVFLQLWVKVKTGWSDNKDLLHTLGLG